MSAASDSDVDDVPPMPTNRYNVQYLRTKARKSGHLIEDAELEQQEPPIERARTNGHLVSDAAR